MGKLARPLRLDRRAARFPCGPRMATQMAGIGRSSTSGVVAAAAAPPEIASRIAVTVIYYDVGAIAAAVAASIAPGGRPDEAVPVVNDNVSVVAAAPIP